MRITITIMGRRRRFGVWYSAAVGEDPSGSGASPADNPIMRVSRTTLVVGTIIFCLTRSAGSEPPVQVLSGSELRNHRLSHLRGMRVENQDGESLGTVKNFIADMDAGEIKYGLVSSGGLLGVRSKMRVVPARALSTATAKKRTVALNVPKSRWKNAPIVKQRDLVLLNNPDRARQISQFYAQAAGTKIGGPKQPLAPPTPTDGEAGATRRLAGRKGSLQLTSDLIGRNVTNQQQQNLGEVSDFVIDLIGSKPTFAIF